MNNHIFNFQSFIFQTPYQKLEPTFPNDSMDLGSYIESNDILLENTLVQDKINKEKNIDAPVASQEVNPIKFENLCEINNNSHLYINNENNISNINEDINSSSVKRNNFLYRNEKIFKIVKINKKIGRIKKDSALKGIHNKFSQDNIIRKIKRRFHENLRLYINREYKKYILNKKNSKKNIINWLKKINPQVSRKIRKEDNLKWFESKIFEIFSENISKRYSAYIPDLNKKKISRLMKLNEATNVIDILNTNIEVLFNKYTNNKKIDGFKTLKDDIDELKKDMEKTNQENIKEYLNKYEYIAKNMKNIFIKKNTRNYKVQKKKK